MCVIHEPICYYKITYFFLCYFLDYSSQIKYYSLYGKSIINYEIKIYSKREIVRCWWMLLFFILKNALMSHSARSLYDTHYAFYCSEIL